MYRQGSTVVAALVAVFTYRLYLDDHAASAWLREVGAAGTGVSAAWIVAAVADRLKERRERRRASR